LFKASLKGTIAKLEGKIESSTQAEMPKSRRICPNVLPTVYGDETCEPNCPPGYPTGTTDLL